MNPYLEPRSHKRIHVQWPVLTTGQNSQHVGDILDLSPGGVFVSPQASHTRSSILRGDNLIFHCQMPFGDAQICGVVRWSNWSDEHQCEGFGIELYQPEPAIYFLIAQQQPQKMSHSRNERNIGKRPPGLTAERPWAKLH